MVGDVVVTELYVLIVGVEGVVPDVVTGELAVVWDSVLNVVGVVVVSVKCVQQICRSVVLSIIASVSYTHLTLPTILRV